MRHVAAVVAVAALAACAQKPPNALPDLSLRTVAGAEIKLRSCPTKECVTAYFAPWCPHCRAAAPGFLGLRDRLARMKITTRFVIGMDNPVSVRDYAKAFGPDTLLDPGNLTAVNGVPHVFVTDAFGRVDRDFPGVPKDGATAEELAQAYGLP